MRHLHEILAVQNVLSQRTQERMFTFELGEFSGPFIWGSLWVVFGSVVSVGRHFSALLECERDAMRHDGTIRTLDFVLFLSLLTLSKNRVHWFGIRGPPVGALSGT